MSLEHDLEVLFGRLSPSKPLPPFSTLLQTPTPPASSAMALGKYDNPADANPGPSQVARSEGTKPVLQVTSPVVQTSEFEPLHGVHVLRGTELPLLPGTIPPLGTSPSIAGLPGAVAGPLVAFTPPTPVDDPMVRFPWPCGRDMLKSELDFRRGSAAEIIATNVPLLDGNGPHASALACQEIIEAIRVNPRAATSALKSSRDNLPKGSTLRRGVNKLLNCGRTLVDFLPFVNGMSTEFNELGVLSDPGQHDVCAAAKANLLVQNRANPARMGAILAGIAEDIDTSTGESERLKVELEAIADELIALGKVGPLGGSPISPDEIADSLSQRILKLYSRLINAEFCHCPAPEGVPFH